MEIKRGMTFRNLQGTKCHIANVFNEGKNEVVTYKYWISHKKRWQFITEFKELFLIPFNYGWKWDSNINSRSIKEILIEADATEELKVLSECWKEIVLNKYSYTIVELQFSKEHLIELAKNMAKKEAKIMKPFFDSLFNAI